jgi:hypothetical protein
MLVLLYGSGKYDNASTWYELALEAPAKADYESFRAEIFRQKAQGNELFKATPSEL